MLKIEQSLRLKQNLILTQELKQGIQLLQLNALELGEFLENEALINAFIDVEIPLKKEIDTEKGEDINFYLDKDYSISDYKDSSYLISHNKDFDIEIYKDISLQETLKDNLLTQLSCLSLTKEKEKLCKIIIENLDDKGYLNSSIKRMSTNLNFKYDELKDALKTVQSLDPPGVGARNLSECIILQLKDKGVYTPDHLLLLKDHIDSIAYDKVKKIANKTGFEEEYIKELISDIKDCNPNMGSEFYSPNTEYIYPEVFLKIEGNNVEIYLKDEIYPKVSINTENIRLLKNLSKSSEGYKFYRENYDKAFFYIKAIDMRKENLLKICKSIFTHQIDFFKSNSLKPLKMEDVANECNVNVSTVSRCVSGKYIDTPLGIFPIKYFFKQEIKSTDNANESSSDLEIKNIINELIENEDKNKPLSDEEISVILKEKKHNISRRTVAKYRLNMGIPTSYNRKNE